MQRTEGIKCFQNNPLGADDSLHTTSFVDQLLNHYRRYRWKGGKPATWSCGNERIKLLKLLGSIPKMANPNICCLPCCCAVPSKELRKRSAVSPLPARTNRWLPSLFPSVPLLTKTTHIIVKIAAKFHLDEPEVGQAKAKQISIEIYSIIKGRIKSP